jgi:hypothetical protein
MLPDWQMFGWKGIVLGIVLFLITFCGSLAIVSFIMVKIPADYFKPDNPRTIMPNHHRAIRSLVILARNLLGVLLVLLGILMSLPGVPGQGLLTILMGIMLLDFPGKRRLEYKLVSKQKVRDGINTLRRKFGKPPLILE